MGKPAGKLELAWYRINGAAPWGYIFLAMFFAAFLCLIVAGATGLMPAKWGPGGDCGPRGMTLVDDC